MKCADFKKKLHEFLDQRLGAQKMRSMENHLSQCGPCQERYQEFILLKEALAVKHVLPQATAKALLMQIKQRRELTWWLRIRDFVSNCGSALRDMDWRFVWSKATAIPLTVCFFLSILIQFAPSRVETMAALLVSSDQQSEHSVYRLLRSVQVRSEREGFRNLMDTAWRLPYEDSLFLVVEITPSGHGEIGNVLEYPKSYALLDAVDSTLKRSRFEANDIPSPLLIYSFQKIDVYGDNRGL